MLENKIWTRAVKVARGVNGDAEELAALVRDHPWLPKQVAMLAPLSDVRALDFLGESALFYAVLCGSDQARQKMVETLAPYADLGAGSRYRLNKSAAMMAVERHLSETEDVTLSLMTSADMEHRCKKGANVWHYICRSSYAELSWIDMVEKKPSILLLLDVEDNEGETPRSLASKRGDDFGAGLLAKAEAIEMRAAIGEAVSVRSGRRL